MNKRGYLFNCTAALALLVLWGSAVRLLCPEAHWSAVLVNAAFAALLYALAAVAPKALAAVAGKTREHSRKE